ncbi:HD-GYP domain-containing protein [Intrasporangium sp.]|uniref:HD-GYP domain-containing protein n=1 Tax=Intrasporangium sp. TaxID=1925024 RepID=UPI00293A933E|nr:HD domain-containing phosphohydrolase [Intrasporangium sp.]MDV3220020.1 HD domain-containing protein [Intrasporangium sp.]
MTAVLGPRRYVPLGAGMAAVVCSAALVYVSADSPQWGDSGSVALVGTFAIAILVGEWFQLSGSRVRGSAPIATAAALGFVFTAELPGDRVVSYGSVFVLAVTGVAMTVAALTRHLTGRPVNVAETVGRFISVAVAALLYRVIHLGQVGGEPVRDDGLEPWRAAVLMLAIAVIGLLADAFVTSTARALLRAAWWQTLKDELRSSFAISVALAVTGVLIALAVPPLGAPAVPLFLSPLVLTLFAFRRYVSIRATYLQSIRTLARLTDAAGYTPAGHSERVAATAVAVGRELGLPERELLDLEYAALLHDIGQVALVEPIPGGATVLAAPADQRRIGEDTLAIVRETGVLDDVARILEHQATPYRQLRELGEEIPLTSRIIKVVNAYEDLTGGSRSRRARDTAVERIYLGLGYEYDPHVVDALLRFLGTAEPPA